MGAPEVRTEQGGIILLGYRSTFAIDLDHTPSTDRDHVVEAVLAEGFHWLHTKKGLDDIDALEPGALRRFPTGHEVAYIHGTTDSGTEYAKLVALDPPSHGRAEDTDGSPVPTRPALTDRDRMSPDDDQSSGERPSPSPDLPMRHRHTSPGAPEHWTTTLLVGLDRRDPRARPQVDIEIDAPRDPTRYGIGGAMFTSRPKLATNILGAFTCDDHGFEVADGPRVLFADEVDDLLRQLAETDHHSLVFLSGTDETLPARTWSDRLEKVTRETVGQAAVFVLDPASTVAFNARVSPAHAIQPYGLRIFRPGVADDDPEDGRRHRSISPRTLVMDSRVTDLRKSFGRLCREHSNTTLPEKFLRRLDVITGLQLDQATGVSGDRSTPVDPSELTTTGVRTEFVSPTLDKDELSAFEPMAENDAPGVIEAGSAARLPGGETPRDVDRADRELVEALAQNAKLHAELDQVQAERRDLIAQIAEARIDISVVRRKAEEDAFEAAEERRRDVENRDEQELENAVLSDELRVLQSQLRTTTYQLDQARRQLTEHGDDTTASYGAPDSSIYGEPLDTWEDLRYLSPDLFPHLIFGDDCWEAAMELAPRDQYGKWARSTWDTLVMLDEYARVRAIDDGFTGGIREYLDGKAPAGAHVIPKGRYRSSESQTVRGHKDWMRERCFRVPTDVSPSGVDEMLTHIEIQTRGSISPRLYFDDRAADLGKVVIGFIGAHPTNTMTS